MTKRRRFVRRFVASSSPFRPCFLGAGERKWPCRKGNGPAAPPKAAKGACPREPHDQPRLTRPARPPPCGNSTTVPGPRPRANQRALRNPATPPQPAYSRRLSGCPQRPTLSAGRPAESPKRENEKEGGTPDGTTAPALPTPGLSRPLRLTMAGRAPSRNAPSVAESPQKNEGGL